MSVAVCLPKDSFLLARHSKKISRNTIEHDRYQLNWKDNNK